MADKDPNYEADLAEARRRIAEEAEARTGFLDLTELDLPELPEELFELTHLRRLHFGWKLVEKADGDWEPARNAKSCTIGRINKASRLSSHLVALSFAGADPGDLEWAHALKGLKWLNLRESKGVDDLTPLAGLTNLQALDCSVTEVLDLTPIAGLTDLETLACFLTGVVDLRPLADLTNLQNFDCRYTKVTDLYRATLERTLGIPKRGCFMIRWCSISQRRTIGRQAHDLCRSFAGGVAVLGSPSGQRANGGPCLCDRQHAGGDDAR